MPTEPVTVLAATPPRAEPRDPRPALRRFPESRATSSAAARSSHGSVQMDELDEPDRAGREVIDVREHDERDDGLHPGQPQRPVPPDARPAVPISPRTGRSSRSARAGPRAAIAASILRAQGLRRPARRGRRDDGLAGARRDGRHLPPLRRLTLRRLSPSEGTRRQEGLSATAYGPPSPEHGSQLRVLFSPVSRVSSASVSSTPSCGPPGGAGSRGCSRAARRSSPRSS